MNDIKSQLKTHSNYICSWMCASKTTLKKSNILRQLFWPPTTIEIGETLWNKKQYSETLCWPPPTPPNSKTSWNALSFWLFSANLETFGNVVFCLDLLEPQSQDFWNSVFLDVSGIFNVLLKPRLNQDSCKTFRIICLLCLLQGSQDIRKTSLKSKKHFSAAITICTFLKGMLVVYEFALSETHHFLTGIL